MIGKFLVRMGVKKNGVFIQMKYFFEFGVFVVSLWGSVWVVGIIKIYVFRLDISFGLFIKLVEGKIFQYRVSFLRDIEYY